VTIPHKQTIIPYLDSLTSEAGRIGAVNTVINRHGRLLGYSTDGFGLARALEEAFGVSTDGGTFVFIGTGGAARACSAYFAVHGAHSLVLVNRTVTKARAVADVIRKANPKCKVTCVPLADPEQVVPLLADADVLVQSTSLGLHENDALPFRPELIPGDLPVLDMIYRQTPFLEAVAARGCPAVDGRGMLLHQGARSFSLWTERPAPVEAMRAALNAALAAREQNRG